MPQVDIHTIGAGGGSIVHARADGTMDVGPESAGAFPGPACYGRGGTNPTISDANVLLGRLPTEHAIASELRLSVPAAQSAFEGLRLKLVGAGAQAEAVTLAAAAIDLAVSKMAAAVREISVHRGFDPREFALVAYGGAGPLHAFLVAMELGMLRVIVPPFPGHVSALGQMCADYRRDFSSPWLSMVGAATLAAMGKVSNELAQGGHEYLTEEGIALEHRTLTCTLDMRYAGQSFTLAIPWDERGDDATSLLQRFHGRHRETFGYANKSSAVEVTAVRVTASGDTEKPPLDFDETYTHLAHSATAPVPATRQVFDGRQWRESRVIDRSRCQTGDTIEGPAVIEDFGATSFMPAGWHAIVHESKALLCEWRGAATTSMKEAS